MNQIQPRKPKGGMTHLFFFVLIVVVVILAFSNRTIEVNTNSGQEDILSVSGSGEVSTQPDRAYMYIKIETVKTTAEQSQTLNKGISNDVIEVLKEQGLKESDIETYRYNIYKKENYNSASRKMEFEGFAVEHIIKATTNRITNVGEILDEAVQKGANGVDRVTFGLSKEKEIDAKSEALSRASDTARQKAEALAQSTGVKLGKIKSVSESSYNYQPYNTYPRLMAEGVAMDDSTTIAPQQLEVTTTVNLVFELK